MTAERQPLLKINCPQWYKREDFRKALNGKHPARKKCVNKGFAGWHVQGKPPTEFSDVFLTYDSGEGSDTDILPEDIWEEICRIAKDEGVTYAMIWLTNLQE